MVNEFLNTPIEYLKGVGPQRAEILKKELSIFVFSDLLNYFPFRYIDRSKIVTIKEINSEDVYIQLKGIITSLETVGEKRGKRLVATFQDQTGTIELVWFKGLKWIKNGIKLNTPYLLFGKPTLFNNRFNITHPDLEEITGTLQIQKLGLQGVYSTSEKLSAKGLHSKGILKLQKHLLEQLPNLPETLPSNIKEQLKLIDRTTAYKNIHLPENPQLLQKAIFRLKFEELFFLQLKILQLKTQKSNTYKGFVFEKVGEKFNTFFNQYLPFELTNAQKRVIKEIRKDVGSGKQMNRLLQGDVGSGKTMVALMSMLLAVDNGFQACLMAPTEILATQHFYNISEALKGIDIKVGLLTGSTKTSERKTLFEDLQNGSLNILIGTHALIEENVSYKNLGLVVVDEQHRFGVAQRAKLWMKGSKNIPPHILVMTATPIPRTLAMTLYGDLDVSVIDELPPGRKPIKTIHQYDASRLKVYGFIEKQIKEGRQVYIVYPLIKESEKLDYKDLMDGYESISRRFPLPEYKVSIVHGQMKPKDKDFEMQRFKKGETQIMVATTVIEVGVDVPNASVMVIESAEKFGLSQLHQLRGRVGRGADQSYCILMTSFKLSEDAKKRIETMVQTNDGFKIAEVDLALRGPGDIQGTQQSGVLGLKLSDLSKDAKILVAARNIAKEILAKDPDLTLPENAVLKTTLNQMNKGKFNWSKIS
ncbi:MAG: ATP-dependent DNA helicase RecG [Vicingaceae bacterium]